MRCIYRNERGITLLEMMLVLAIGAAIIVMSIRQYEVFKIGSDAELITANVNKIFQAASYFYYAQCPAIRPNSTDTYRLSPTPPTNPTPGLPTSVSKPVILDIKNDLINAGYMDDIPSNPLVNDQAGGGAYKGYMVQLTRQDTIRYICTEPQPGKTTTDPNSTNCKTKKQIGTSVGWQIQVSVMPRNSKLTQQIQSMSSADCTTSTTNSNAVVSCPNATNFANSCAALQSNLDSIPVGSPFLHAAQVAYVAAGCHVGAYSNIVSFQRSPSFSAATDAQSGLSMDDKALHQFKLQYETDNINQLLTESHTPETQYFTCGN